MDPQGFSPSRNTETFFYMATLTKGFHYGQKIVLLEILVKLSSWIREILLWSRLEVRELCGKVSIFRQIPC
ncbi:hypothetical protein NC652_027370 [Populus alba x Populus x berolinensis]|nr:hypothetical protein NC652_027370 [Populus alba x Populus x berolinensis]